MLSTQPAVPLQMAPGISVCPISSVARTWVPRRQATSRRVVLMPQVSQSGPLSAGFSLGVGAACASCTVGPTSASADVRVGLLVPVLPGGAGLTAAIFTILPCTRNGLSLCLFRVAVTSSGFANVISLPCSASSRSVCHLRYPSIMTSCSSKSCIISCLPASDGKPRTTI